MQNDCTPPPLVMAIESHFKEYTTMRRNTERQNQILELLSGADWYLEVGTQPFSASTVTELLNMAGATVNSVRNTLKLMADKGLVIVERKPAEVRTGWGEVMRQLDHYWNAETQAHDKITADEYNALAPARQEAALAQMFGR